MERLLLRLTPYLLSLLLVLFSGGCATSEIDQNLDGDDDTTLDGDIDGISDADDGDSDGDNGEDSDGDSDFDADSDANGDQDSDTDGSDDDGNSDGAGEGDGNGDGIDVCPGGCASDETCTEDGCVNLCARDEYQCGDWTIDGFPVQCGSCPQGSCQGGQCEDICEQFHAQCGSIYWDGQSFDCDTCTGTARCRNNQCAQNQGFVELSAGSEHTCGLRPNGEVRCWGANQFGQLGNNQSPTSYNSPQPVFSLTTAIQVASLNNHTCITREDGQVRCWGRNNTGQLGNGNIADAPVPVEANTINSAQRVKTGGSHTCVLLGNERLRCWGQNGQSQLGRGEPSIGAQHDKSDVLRLLNTPLDSVFEFALGAAFSCALRKNNSVWCWGFNNAGQLGLGDNSTGRNFATELTNLPPATQLEAGNNHACALTVGGDVYCWGRGAEGQVGHGLFSNSLSPTAVSLPEPAIHIATGGSHSCAALITGAVFCWGSDSHGQLGRGTTGQNSNSPVQVSGLSNVHLVTGGLNHSCALNRNGQAFCWGRNENGQLGNGSNTDRSTPVSVSN